MKRQTSVTSSDNEWQWMTMIGTTGDSKWRVVQQMTKSDNEWQRVVQRVTPGDNEWQQITTSDNEWQRMTTSGTRNENGTVHFKEWMIAILSMIKTDILLQGMDGCN